MYKVKYKLMSEDGKKTLKRTTKVKSGAILNANTLDDIYLKLYDLHNNSHIILTITSLKQIP